MRRLIICCALLLGASAQAAATPLLEFGRYRPLYPGLYGDFSFSRDEQDKSFDARGEEQDSALPSLGGESSFPQDALSARFRWYFPMFEEEQLPFFSGRLHTARLTARLAQADAEGVIAGFAERNGLQTESSGLGDLSLEFGSFLAGSDNWREGKPAAFSLLALIGLNAATGRHDVESPYNVGSNEHSLHFQLGAHWQPAAAWLLDGGITFRRFEQNEEPAFGGAEPAERGDETLWDLSIARRFGQNFYVTAFYYDRNGDANQYENPRFIANPPAPASGMQTFPTPGVYRDGGTQLSAIGLSLSWFARQNWLLGLHVFQPRDGESGEFELPFSQQPSSCTLLNNCNPQPSGQSRRVDGLGGARSYASQTLMLTVTHSFGRSDPWL
ncbi:MAG: transporter [Nevskiales bacterium]